MIARRTGCMPAIGNRRLQLPLPQKVLEESRDRRYPNNDGDSAAEVPVFVRAEGGERTKRMLAKGKSKAVDRVEVPTTPNEAVVNDGSVPESNMNNNAMAVAPK